MTRDELIRLGCGEYCSPQDTTEWLKKKRKLYAANKVMPFYFARRSFHLKIDPNQSNATRRAQVDTDARLFEMAENPDKVYSPTACEGDELIPKSLHRKKQLPKGDGLFNENEFNGTANVNVSPLEYMDWVANHIKIRVKPSDAPCPAAYSLLMWVKEDSGNLKDFWTSMFPRTLPAKSQIENQSKFNDDNRTTFDLLSRLQGEGKDGSGEVPVL